MTSVGWGIAIEVSMIGFGVGVENFANSGELFIVTSFSSSDCQKKREFGDLLQTRRCGDSRWRGDFVHVFGFRVPEKSVVGF